MRVLHINNGYVASKVHSNLMRELDLMGVEQTLYCPVRRKEYCGLNQFYNSNITFVFSYCIKMWYRYQYHFKASKLYKDMCDKIDLKSFDFVHAATLFSDGVLAYKAYNEFGIPYSIAVRSVDTNDFIKRRIFHTWQIGRNILKSAKYIYFISQSGMKQFSNSSFAQSILQDIEKKMVLRPNGIDADWINNIDREPRTGKTICYIGTFLHRKNVNRLIYAIQKLRDIDGYNDIRLKIIGGGFSEDGSTDRLVNKHCDFIDFLGQISDREELRNQMRKCLIFAMPSFTETFGLVYIEALSQNLPIVYTKNDGIDGLVDKMAGVGVNPKSVDDIMNAIKQIIDNQIYYNNKAIDFLEFSWPHIASLYLNDYKKK